MDLHSYVRLLSYRTEVDPPLNKGFLQRFRTQCGAAQRAVASYTTVVRNLLYRTQLWILISLVSSKAFDIGLHLHVSKIAVYLSWCSCIHTRPRADATAACHHGHATADDGTTRVRVPTSGSADQYIQRYGRVTYGNAYFTAGRPTVYISAPACGKFQPNLIHLGTNYISYSL